MLSVCCWGEWGVEGGHRESWPQQPALSQLWRLRDRITTSNARGASRGDDPFMSSYPPRLGRSALPPPPDTTAGGRVGVSTSVGDCLFEWTLSRGAPFFIYIGSIFTGARCRRTLKSHQFRGTWRRLTRKFHQFRFASLHTEN